MQLRPDLFTWNFLFTYQYYTIWCEIIKNRTVVDNFVNLDNETSAEEKTKNQTINDVIEYCVDNVTCKYVDGSPELEQYGTELLEHLPEEFPVAFKMKVDVNITLENKILDGFLMEDDGFAENEIDPTDNTGIFDNSTLETDIATKMKIKFSKYIEKSGKLRLKTLAYKVKNLVNPTLYLNHIIKVPKYLSELRKYMAFILQKKVRCELDEHFIIFDMLETSVKIFGKASEEISGVVVQESNITLSLNQIDIIEEAIGFAVYNEKKEAFKYICESTSICRRYPAYSDYLVKLLKSIIKLQQIYFITIVDILEDAIQEKVKFLKSIMHSKISDDITLQLKNIVNNPSEVGSLMNVIIKNILQRFKVYYINGVEIRNNTKAIRILLDMIDISFHVFNEDTITADFRELRKHITEWARGKQHDIKKILSDFVHDAINFLDVYWTHEIKEEVKVLIELMITGSSVNVSLRDRLFTKGSKIASGEHIIYAENEEFDNKI